MLPLLRLFSTRDPIDNQVGFSDIDAMVGRAGKTYSLGYKLHLAIDSKTMLPLASLVVSANQNEKKHSLALVEKTKALLAKSNIQLRSIIADSQYSNQKQPARQKVTPPTISSTAEGLKEQQPKNFARYCFSGNVC